ncbi:MAG: phosphatase PAP2 family protein [Hyphomicrobiales bacterium]
MVAGSPSRSQTASSHGVQARFATLFGASLGAHLPFIVLIGLYSLAAQLTIGRMEGIVKSSFSTSIIDFVVVTVPILFLAVLTMRFVHLVLNERPASPLLALYEDMKAYLGDPVRLAAALPMILTLIAFFRTFTLIKANIPAVQPFVWDGAFIELDRVLHFGRQPWEWLQPVLGYGPVTFLISFLYNLWFIVMWIFWVWFAFDKEDWHLRSRFFLSFILIWIIGGGLLAVGFSSAGPCYLASLGMDDSEFAGLMAYLHNVSSSGLPLMALDVQQMLWDGYVLKTGAGGGISAMPSLHNASALLFALAAWRLNRVAGILASIFAGIIFIGSVHLGWHYAVDGYVGFALALAVWWASKPLATWMDGLSFTRRFLILRGQSGDRAPSTPSQ